MQEDRDVQREVIECLANAPGVDPADIGVSVQNGVVVLTGVVDTFDEREAAEKAVLGIAGVLDIVNEIDVQVPHQAGPSDEQVAEGVRSTLELRCRAPHEHIKCSVSHGVVTLHGSAPTWQDVADAEEAVGEVAGVEDVVDELVVAPE